MISHRPITALAVCFTLLAPTSSGLLAASDASRADYEVVDGAVLVFGHRLETENPLPEIGDCEGCGKIGLVSSPDGRRVLIVSDVPFEANDIWLYDRANGQKPVHVAGKRLGRHLTTAWLSDRIFELRWTGMGYSTSLLFDAAEPDAGRRLDDLLHYDAGRDVYVRYYYDWDAVTDAVEIGSVFAASVPAERFPVALAGFRSPDASGRFSDVAIDDERVIVTYVTGGDITVQAEFRPRILQDPK